MHTSAQAQPKRRIFQVFRVNSSVNCIVACNKNRWTNTVYNPIESNTKQKRRCGIIIEKIKKKPNITKIIICVYKKVSKRSNK